MDKYYYLVSQLPMLFFDKEPAISYENFMAEAEKWLSPKDFALVSTLDMAEMAAKRVDPAVLKAYKEAEQEIRNDLVAWRREKKSGREHKPAAFPASAVKDGNPLQVEKNLLKLRWDLLSEMESGHHFDLESIVLYRLKLQILQRLAQFNKERGMEKYQSLYKVSL